MNVIQRPRPREFCATMPDYVIDTDASVTFAVRYRGKPILEEEYAPDAKYVVRARRLGQLCEQALWGVWPEGDTTWQADASGEFAFLIDGKEDAGSLVTYSRLQTRKDAASPGWLTETRRKVTHPGCHEWLSVRATEAVVAYPDGDRSRGAELLGAGVATGEAIATLDVGAARMAALFPGASPDRYVISAMGQEFELLVDRSRYPDIWQFRYKNVYDMPETLQAVGGLQLAGANEGTAASMFGVERKFAVKVTDEYTANSGAIFLRSDFRLWHNLLNAREAEVWAGDRWLPIVVTKQKFERELRRGALKAVEFSFRMADPGQNNLIDLQ
ncbi:MAG: hypothetical protein LBN29_11325 [Mediterranea sp.]|jgi:hypothetical protein|nr:hypothetical protein [Mediterranea sp.]